MGEKARTREDSECVRERATRESQWREREREREREIKPRERAMREREDTNTFEDVCIQQRNEELVARTVLAS